MNRPSAHASLLDELLVPAIALAILVGATVWLTGQLAALLTHGAWPAVGADDLGGIVARLVQSPGDPASAWPAPVREELPGPVLFYAVLVGVGAAPVAIWVWWTERRRARREVRPDAARWATRRDLRPLRVRRGQEHGASEVYVPFRVQAEHRAPIRLVGVAGRPPAVGEQS